MHVNIISGSVLDIILVAETNEEHFQSILSPYIGKYTYYYGHKVVESSIQELGPDIHHIPSYGARREVWKTRIIYIKEGIYVKHTYNKLSIY